MAALPAAALAEGRDVLADYEDNGRIDACYTPQEFAEALDRVRADQRQYGAAVDVILEAQLTNVKRPGEECPAATATAPTATTPEVVPEPPPSDAGGGAPTALIVVGAVAGVVVVGGGAWALTRRRSG